MKKKQTSVTNQSTGSGNKAGRDQYVINHNAQAFNPIAEILQYKDTMIQKLEIELSKSEGDRGLLYAHIEELNKQLEFANNQLAELRKYNHVLLMRKSA